jgi:hypothetical protein
VTIKQRWKQTSLANKLLIIVGAFAAFSTGLSVMLAYFHYGLATRSSEETSIQINRIIQAADSMSNAMQVANENQMMAIEKATENSQAAIEATAKIAADQLKSQRDAYQLEQRAWLSLNVRINQAGQIRLPIANSGVTPAFDVIGTVMYSVSRPENLQAVTEATWARMPQVRLGTIPRQETGRELMPASDLTADETARYKAGQRLYVFARLRYCDAFGYQHRLEICTFSLANNPDIAYCGRTEDPATSRVACNVPISN